MKTETDIGDSETIELTQSSSSTKKPEPDSIEIAEASIDATDTDCLNFDDVEYRFSRREDHKLKYGNLIPVFAFKNSRGETRHRIYIGPDCKLVSPRVLFSFSVGLRLGIVLHLLVLSKQNPILGRNLPLVRFPSTTSSAARNRRQRPWTGGPGTNRVREHSQRGPGKVVWYYQEVLLPRVRHHQVVRRRALQRLQRLRGQPRPPLPVGFQVCG